MSTPRGSSDRGVAVAAHPRDSRLTEPVSRSTSSYRIVVYVVTPIAAEQLQPTSLKPIEKARFRYGYGGATEAQSRAGQTGQK